MCSRGPFAIPKKKESSPPPAAGDAAGSSADVCADATGEADALVNWDALSACTPIDWASRWAPPLMPHRSPNHPGHDGGAGCILLAQVAASLTPQTSLVSAVFGLATAVSVVLMTANLLEI